MSGKGKFLESAINRANDGYLYRGIALVDKVETSTVVQRGPKGITGVTFKAGPKVDYSGAVFGDVRRIPVSLEAKESEDEVGLPLKHIRDNQIDYMRLAVPFGIWCIALVYAVPYDKFYRIPAADVLRYWDTWQENKGRHGYNRIPYNVMEEVMSRDGIVIDYLCGLYDPDGVRAELDAQSIYRYIGRGQSSVQPRRRY